MQTAVISGSIGAFCIQTARDRFRDADRELLDTIAATSSCPTVTERAERTRSTGCACPQLAVAGHLTVWPLDRINQVYGEPAVEWLAL
jgi:hypothetical protein